MMIILDKPYISEFQLNTLEKKRIPVIHNALVDEVAQGRDLFLISPEEAIWRFTADGDQLLYSNSENSISWIENNL